MGGYEGVPGGIDYRGWLERGAGDHFAGCWLNVAGGRFRLRCWGQGVKNSTTTGNGMCCGLRQTRVSRRAPRVEFADRVLLIHARIVP